VDADCEAGGYAAARHLIGRGHRDIATLSESKPLKNIDERIAGARRALLSAGLPWRLLMRRRSGMGTNDVERTEFPCTLKARESSGPALGSEQSRKPAERKQRP
jgi:DNA-binding LacI/PurR family transcriptional regulator